MKHFLYYVSQKIRSERYEEALLRLCQEREDDIVYILSKKTIVLDDFNKEDYKRSPHRVWIRKNIWCSRFVLKSDIDIMADDVYTTTQEALFLIFCVGEFLEKNGVSVKNIYNINYKCLYTLLEAYIDKEQFFSLCLEYNMSGSLNPTSSLEAYEELTLF